MMNFEPFQITLYDDGETVERAHVNPELTMLTMSVNGVKEPTRIMDTKYFLMVADAVNSAVTANVELTGAARQGKEQEMPSTELLTCPECGSIEIAITAEQMFMANTGDHYCHSVKVQDADAKAVCLACRWTGQRKHLVAPD